MYSFSLINKISMGQVPEETQKIIGNPLPEKEQNAALLQVFACMDFTSLEGTDHPEKIRNLCLKVLSFGEKGLPFPAAVCIYPPFISMAKQTLKGTPVKVATTAAAFPGGQLPLHLKLEEIKYAVGEGADEIDVVISRGTFLAGDYNRIFRELDAMREVAGNKTLKVILETGELQSPENIARASEIAIEAGADFIKTSTGKTTPAATEEAVYVMLRVIREYHTKTGKQVGIKPAGGIADPAAALNYYLLVQDILGKSWLQPGLFRIGASRLADRIIDFIS